MRSSTGSRPSSRVVLCPTGCSASAKCAWITRNGVSMRPLQESDVFHAIAHPARRAILVELKGGERAASELAAPFDMTFAAISQHLKVLEEADLVSVRRDGRQRFYKLEPKPLRDVVSWIRRVLGVLRRAAGCAGRVLGQEAREKAGLNHWLGVGRGTVLDDRMAMPGRGKLGRVGSRPEESWGPKRSSKASSSASPSKTRSRASGSSSSPCPGGPTESP